MIQDEPYDLMQRLSICVSDKILGAPVKGKSVVLVDSSRDEILPALDVCFGRPVETVDYAGVCEIFVYEWESAVSALGCTLVLGLPFASYFLS